MRRTDNPIYFQAAETRTSDFLHELGERDLVRAARPSAESTARLREAQIARLRRNIEVLRAKQDEFNRRMEEYIGQLQRLTESLATRGEPDASVDAAAGTHVRCLRCESEYRFDGLEVLFARESEDALDQPTQCYVSDHGEIKKGQFGCRSCGSQSLVIRSA